VTIILRRNSGGIIALLFTFCAAAKGFSDL
jgi:hypothetical protein